MILSEKERRILGAVQLQADAPAAEIARLTGIREHAIHYCLQGLRQKGIIKKRPMTDVHRMGFTQYSFFFSALYESSQARMNLLRFLLESDRTSDVFELGGDFQYGVVLTVQDMQEAFQFLEALSQMSGVSFIEKSFSTRISTSLFQRGYLAHLPDLPTDVTYRHSEESVQLDETDHLVLSALHQRSWTSLRDLARQLDMPHTSLAHRVKKLEDTKTIIGYVYGIASQLFGMDAFRLLVYTKGFDYHLWYDLFDFSREHPNILCLFQCLGSWDYEFEVEVENRQDITTVSQELYELLGSKVVTIKTLPLLSFPKSTGYPYSLAFSEDAPSWFTQ